MPIIQVNMLEGRSSTEKRAMVAAVTDAVVRTLGANPQSVRIMIHELKAENYALAGTSAADLPLNQRARTNGSAPQSATFAGATE